MRYYNLLFIGLIGLAPHTYYRDIPVIVASMFMGLIIEMNLIAIIDLTTWRPILLSKYILIPFFAIVTLLNINYYNKHKVSLDKLEAELKETHDQNISSGQLLAIFVIIESVMIVPLTTLMH